MRDRQSQNIQTARTYTIIGSIVTAVIGLILVIIGAISNFILYLVVGFLALFLALTSYMTTSEKIRTGDPEGSKTPCLLFGILLLIFGGVIGGIFFLLAHVKLTETSPPLPPKPIYHPTPDTPGGVTEDEEFPPIGVLECVSGPDKGTSYDINRYSMTIGRGWSRKTGGNNDIQLSERDRSVSRAQGEIRGDPDTGLVSIAHVSNTSKTLVNGGILVPGEKKQLKNNNKIEFGKKGAKWVFKSARASTTRGETE